jgi:hypothetical protein
MCRLILIGGNPYTLALVGRQRSFAGVGRFDLLFEDGFKTTILMELKAKTLKYEDATQVAKYRDELKRNGSKNVSNVARGSAHSNIGAEFLDDKGIEYSEFTLTEFRRIAERRGFVIKSKVEPELPPEVSTSRVATDVVFSPPRQTRRDSSAVPTGPIVTAQSVFRWRAAGYDLILDNPLFPTYRRFKHFTGIVDSIVEFIGHLKAYIIRS